MFTVKICGITRVEDALAAAEAGADAIGLNFYAKSPRFVSTEQARSIADAVAGGPLLVGVFVNAASKEIGRLVDSLGLGAVQLHGDEPPEFLAGLPPGIPVLRATRIGAEGLGPVAGYRDHCRAMGYPPAAVLLDASVPSAPGGATVYGGSGHRLDWPRVAAERSLLAGTPLILAGGLTPENVAEAIRVSGADGVDTASGVESAPGVKDPAMVRDFVGAAREAFGSR